MTAASLFLAKLNKSADVRADVLPLEASKIPRPLREFSHNSRNKILTFLLQLRSSGAAPFVLRGAGFELSSITRYTSIVIPHSR
jgi:hypothetical protein